MSTETRQSDSVAEMIQARDEWIAAVDTLYRQVETWANSRGWTTRRKPVVLDEKRLGPYEVWRLIVKTEQGRVVFRPVARYVVGGMGLIDLKAPPARYASQMLCRYENETWKIHPFGDSEVESPWTEANFVHLAETLIQSASRS